MAPKASSSKAKGKKRDTTMKKKYKPAHKRAAEAAEKARNAPARPPRVQKPRAISKKKAQEANVADRMKMRVEKDDDDLPNNYPGAETLGKTFVEGSEANMTWGDVDEGGTVALKSARRGNHLAAARERKEKGVREARRVRRTADGLVGGFEMDEDSDMDYDAEAEAEFRRLKKEEADRIATFRGHCWLTELPKELREEIYGWVFAQEKPVVVHCDWIAVYRIAGVKFDHHIIKVHNKVISEEAAKYFYQHSTLHGLVRSAIPNWKHLDKIDARFHRMFRDVVLETAERDPAINPEERRTHQSLVALRSADCHLNTLTIVLAPYRIRNPHAQNLLAQVDPNRSAIAYADWFKPGSDIHRDLTKGVRAREIFVVLKLKAGGKPGKVAIRINAVHLTQNFDRTQLIDPWEVVRERIVALAEAAKKEVEKVALDIEALTNMAESGLSWDQMRVQVAIEEAERKKGSRDVGLGRMRVMDDEESVEGLKWWTREQKVLRKVAEASKLKSLVDSLDQTSVDNVAEEMEDVQPTPEVDPTPPAPAPADPADPCPQLPGESNIAAAYRARRYHLRQRAALKGSLPSAPGPEPEPELAPEPGTLEAVFNLTVHAPPVIQFEKDVLEAMGKAAEAKRVAEMGPFAALLAGDEVGESGADAGGSEEAEGLGEEIEGGLSGEATAIVEVDMEGAVAESEELAEESAFVPEEFDMSQTKEGAESQMGVDEPAMEAMEVEMQAATNETPQAESDDALQTKASADSQPGVDDEATKSMEAERDAAMDETPQVESDDVSQTDVGNNSQKGVDDELVKAMETQTEATMDKSPQAEEDSMFYPEVVDPSQKEGDGLTTAARALMARELEAAMLETSKGEEDDMFFPEEVIVSQTHGGGDVQMQGA